MASSVNLLEKETVRAPRQSPGSACDECRRRKLRCDRAHPRCGVCTLSGVVCNTTSTRPARGPKRGQIRAMQNRIATLERHILEQQGGILPSGDELNLPAPGNEDSDPQSPCNPELPCQDQEEEWKSSEAVVEDCIPDLICAELDQLYFDRVPVCMSILHQRRYFHAAKQSPKSEAFACLQYAVWTLAAASSAQFDKLQRSLYQSTVTRLKAFERKNPDHEKADIVIAQAWILLTFYECTQMGCHHGWFSAGRSFRLVQFLRLYEIDSPESVDIETNWVKTEERRRTFWAAYCLDQFISLQNGFPATFCDEVISTRLPAAEPDFQSGQPVVMDFLSQAMANPNYPTMSSFTECIIMAAICGRCLSHGQQWNVRRASGDLSFEFWNRHLWLDTSLQQRIQLLSLQYSSAAEYVDSLLLFTNLMLHALVLYLYKIITPVNPDAGEVEAVILEYKTRSFSAAQEIIAFAKSLRQLTYFKICPFTPIPLFLCAEYLLTNREGDIALDPYFQDILDVLRDMKNLNNLARVYLISLGQENIGATFVSG